MKYNACWLAFAFCTLAFASSKAQEYEVDEEIGSASSAPLWHEGPEGFPVVFYRFEDEGLDEALLQEAMDYWRDSTCLNFEFEESFAEEELPSEESAEEEQPYIAFRFSEDGGCYVENFESPDGVGVRVFIGPACNTPGSIAYLLGLALGFMPEHQRPDRDEFLFVNFENIIEEMLPAFEMLPSDDDSLGVQYDYFSIMQFPSTAFSLNGKPTLVPKYPLAQTLLGQRRGLSHRDQLLANRKFGCIGKRLADCGLDSDPCQNDGYYGEDCACVCPLGTSGDFCEIIEENYHDALIKLNSCNERVTEEGLITFPNNGEGQCVKVIEAPECFFPIVKFLRFELSERDSECLAGSCCSSDALEIRNNNLNNGEIFCGGDISEGQSFIGEGRQIILYFRSNNENLASLSAEVTFERQRGQCSSGGRE